MTRCRLLATLYFMAFTIFAVADTAGENTDLQHTELTMQKLDLPKGSIDLIHGDGKPKYAIIWLHGLGATADDFPPIVPELDLASDLTVRFIFPQARNRPITINGGMSMPGWYDIKGLTIEDKQDAIGMAESSALVESIIEQLIEHGFKSQHIVLAGFSQGGAVTYFAGLRSKRTLGGLLTLSTYLPFDGNTASERAQENSNTPIFASHGTYDAVVPLNMGEHSVQVLKDLGYDIQWQTYPMEHQVSMPQIKHIGAWLNKVFSN